jgi:hypothetical protein
MSYNTSYYNSFHFYNRCRDEIIPIISAPKFTYFVTVAFNLSESANLRKLLEDMPSIFERWHRNVDRIHFGKRFYNVKDTEASYRTQYYGRVEHPNSNVHMHLKVAVCPSKRRLFEEYAAEVAMRKEFSRADVKVDSLNTLEDRLRTSQYMMKDAVLPQNRELYVVSPNLQMSL